MNTMNISFAQVPTNRPLFHKKLTSQVPLQKPKRALNWYNLFFKHHRSLIIEEGKIPFGDLAREISVRRKNATQQEMDYFKHLAELDRVRHVREMKVWKKHNKDFHQRERAAAVISPMPASAPLPPTPQDSYNIDEGLALLRQRAIEQVLLLLAVQSALTTNINNNHY